MTSSGSARASAPERTVFGGFSMGSVMSYSLGLGGRTARRPPDPGVLAASCPTVEGWEPDLEGRRATRVFIAHGRRDR